MKKSKGIDFVEANRIARETLRDWYPEIDSGKRSGEWVNGIPNPTRNDRNTDSFGINTERGFYHDFAGESHDLVHLYATMNGLSQKEAARAFLPPEPEPYDVDIEAIKANLLKKNEVKIPGEWDYVHLYTDGVCSFYVCRRNARGDQKKEIRQFSFVDGKFAPKKPPKPAHGYPLLNLDKILSAGPDQEIVLVEGEVKSESIPDPYIATSIAGGANAWKDTDLSPLAGHSVILWPDNDEPGKKCMAEIRDALSSSTVKMIIPSPEWPMGADAANFSYDERLEILKSAKTEEKKQIFPITSFDEIEIKPPRWLIKGVLEANSFSCFFGASGSGKSYTVLSMACCIATKQAFFGHDVKETGPIIYIAGEGFSGIGKRLRAWEKYHNQEIPKKSIFVSACAACLGDDAFMVHVTESVKNVAEKHGKPSLIIIDTWARNMTGNENDTADTSAAIRSLDRLRQDYECSAIVVHHTGKADSERARGSSALRAALDTEYQVENQKDIVTVKNTKMKDGEMPECMTFAFEYVDLGIQDEDGEPVFSSVITPIAAGILNMKNPIETKKSEEAAINILSAFPEGMPVREFHAAMKNKGMVQRTVKRVKDELETSGKIKIDGGLIYLVDEEKPVESEKKPWEKKESYEIY